jgi:hypothetical protein
MAVVLLVLFVLPWAALAYSEALGSGPKGWDWQDNLVEIGLNPVRTWWQLGFNWPEFREDVCGAAPLQGPLGAIAIGLLIYAMSAGLLWLAAWLQFRREPFGEAEG